MGVTQHRPWRPWFSKRHSAPQFRPWVQRERQEPNQHALIAWTYFFLIYFCRAKKGTKRNPSAKITFLYSFHPHFPSAGSQGWAGPSVCSPHNSEHSAIKASSLLVCMCVGGSPASLIHWRSRPTMQRVPPRCVASWAVAGTNFQDSLLSSPPSFVRRWRSCRSHVTISAHCTHVLQIHNWWHFYVWIVLCWRLDYGVQKPAFEKKSPQIMVLFIINISSSHCF